MLIKNFFIALKSAVSNGPKRVDVSLSLSEDGHLQFPEHCVFYYLEFQLMDKVRKPSNLEVIFWLSVVRRLGHFSAKTQKMRRPLLVSVTKRRVCKDLAQRGEFKHDAISLEFTEQCRFSTNCTYEE
jgi:hypothetical protein